MHPDYTIRPTRAADVPLLPAVERAANTRISVADWDGDSHVTDADTHRAYQQAGRSWVAVDGRDQPVGFALASVEEGGAHLDEVDVHPDHGRRGIGRALVEQVFAWARACGYPAITLTTERYVPWNGPFYATMGFEIVPPEEWTPVQRARFAHEAALSPASADRVLMRRSL